MRWRTALAVVLGTCVLASPAGAAEHDDWRDLLDRAEEAARGRSFEGRLVVVSFDGEPTIGMVTVTRDEDGMVVTDRDESWMVGHVAGRSFLGDIDTKRLLRLGAARADGFAVHRLTDKYEVAVEGSEPGVAGEVAVLVFTERGTGALRERLHIDRSSGVVVRRETYDGDGDPVRLTAFTALDMTPVDLPVVEATGMHTIEAERAPVSEHSVEILRDVGWRVPEELPEGFVLGSAAAIGEGEATTLHLSYSDGLYTVSVYEQHGTLDRDAMVAGGATPADLGAVRAWRWPGSEPATYVWDGNGLTFTAVTDAPPDVIAAALAGLPHDGPPSLGTRLRRGFARVFSWAWPFD